MSYSSEEEMFDIFGREGISPPSKEEKQEGGQGQIAIILFVLVGE